MLIIKSNINDHEANFNLGILCKKKNELKKSLTFFERASTYKPYLFEVPDQECIDLDNKKDFEYLEYYVKNNLYSSK